ncbi:MAG: hypothetical protein WCK09_07505 [Bacteroidota bacterium]
MKKYLAVLLTIQFLCITTHKLFSQSSEINKEFGITTGALTNFPANANYLKDNITVFYLAPYVRTGKHEFCAGITYSLSAKGLVFPYETINPRPGATAGYKFYVFDVYGRENLFIHYSFQYLRFSETYWSTQSFSQTETDMYINNVIGLGYSLFFDSNERFGFFYTLDYVISQAGYKLNSRGSDNHLWTTQYVWNNISTNFGFTFKLTSLKKKDKK